MNGHQERRGYHLRCTCGYQAKDRNDLDEHIEAMTRHQEGT